MTPQDVKYIAIHAAATKPGMDIGAKEIQEWHRERGWSEIGYHYVIRRDGYLERGGRMLYEQGAHVAGWNHCSVGICLVGGIDNNGLPQNNFTPNQYTTLEDLLIELRMFYPDAVIQGHRDFPDVRKACPCFDVKTWLQEVGL